MHGGFAVFNLAMTQAYQHRLQKIAVKTSCKENAINNKDRRDGTASY